MKALHLRISINDIYKVYIFTKKHCHDHQRSTANC